VLTVLFIVVAAGLVVASVLTDSLPLAIAGLVVALVALGLIVWPVLMARRAAAVAAEEREEAAAQEPVAEKAVVAEGPVLEKPAPAEERAPAGEPAPTGAPAAEAPGPAAAEPAAVLVVPGRHRYHRAGCSMLEGREPETLDLDEAREEGFTPCSRCVVGALTRS
jgi:hypothetical protein